jgi:hypothetical protein
MGGRLGKAERHTEPTILPFMAYPRRVSTGYWVEGNVVVASLQVNHTRPLSTFESG